MANHKIYIVEDSFIVSFHLKKILEIEGYDVVGISDSGEDAVRDMDLLKPDLVLMDIMLVGKMDGIQTAAIIKKELDIPVIYITALTDKETIKRAKITEPYGYVTKPFEDREIFTVIEMALYKSSIEKKLRESEEKFLSTLKSISDCVVTIDNTYCITYANPSAESLIGMVLEEMQGHNFFEVFLFKNSHTGEMPINPLKCNLNSGQFVKRSDDLVLIANDGTEISVIDAKASSIKNSKDKPTGLVLTFKDGRARIERKRFEEEVKRQRLFALIEGQENERTRIAKDLHDGLGQILNAIKMNVNTFVPDKSMCRDFSFLLDEAITEAKRIAENLLPYKLRDFDLATCLDSLCDQLRPGAKANINFSAFVDNLEISQNVKINLYRIAQEALTNSIRHSNASTISMQLIEDDEMLRLTIEDDGNGMENQINSTGRGIVNMSDRAKILNGSCSIESDSNRGTIVIIEIPK